MEVDAMAPTELVHALADAATALEASAAELNRLDSFAGDGDMGVTMSEAARALKEVLAAGAQEVRTAKLLSSCGAAIARKAPSTSGTLVATGFLRAAKALADSSAEVPQAPASTVELELAFRAALEGIQARGKASIGDRTLVDGLDAVCTSLREAAAAGRGPGQALHFAAQAAEAKAKATASMVPKVGRASWVPERAVGHPDAGCTMLAIVLRAAASSVAGP